MLAAALMGLGVPSLEAVKLGSPLLSVEIYRPVFDDVHQLIAVGIGKIDIGNVFGIGVLEAGKNAEMGFQPGFDDKTFALVEVVDAVDGLEVAEVRSAVGTGLVGPEKQVSALFIHLVAQAVAVDVHQGEHAFIARIVEPEIHPGRVGFHGQVSVEWPDGHRDTEAAADGFIAAERRGFVVKKRDRV